MNETYATSVAPNIQTDMLPADPKHAAQAILETGDVMGRVKDLKDELDPQNLYAGSAKKMVLYLERAETGELQPNLTVRETLAVAEIQRVIDRAKFRGDNKTQVIKSLEGALLNIE